MNALPQTSISKEGPVAHHDFKGLKTTTKNTTKSRGQYIITPNIALNMGQITQNYHGFHDAKMTYYSNPLKQHFCCASPKSSFPET